MQKVLFTSIGWVGAVLCTLGYVLLSLKVIRAETLVFQILNVIGGFCLCVTAIDASDLPNASANLMWMFTGLFALGRQFFTNRTRKH